MKKFALKVLKCLLFMMQVALIEGHFVTSVDAGAFQTSALRTTT